MSRLFHHVPVGVWTQISVVVFLTIFLFIVAWVFSPSRCKTYDRASKLPLEGEPHGK